MTARAVLDKIDRLVEEAKDGGIVVVGLGIESLIGSWGDILDCQVAFDKVLQPDLSFPVVSLPDEVKVRLEQLLERRAPHLANPGQMAGSYGVVPSHHADLTASAHHCVALSPFCDETRSWGVVGKAASIGEVSEDEIREDIAERL